MAKKREVQPKARLLLVDGDAAESEHLVGLLEAEGYDVTHALSLSKGVCCLEAGWYQLVLADVHPPGGSGLELLSEAARHGEASVILMAAYGTPSDAVEAMRRGAVDYLCKPISPETLLRSVRRAIESWELAVGSRSTGGRHAFDNLIGADVGMAQVFELIEAVADSRSTILITGESGTGKSLVARAIHAHSPRRDKPFVEVSCGALPDTLLESELFGHVRGAFTNAIADKPGKFAAAEGGTIFLDEVSTASPQLQVKLLRVLQERTFEPLGSNETKHADVRVILATNRELWGEVEAGRFRRDLYYRINVVNIELPALRDRPSDIPLLAEHFLRCYLRDASRRISGLSPEATATMERYDWPGNVRELENAVERAVVLCRGGQIGVEDLPPAVVTGARRERQSTRSPRPVGTLKSALAAPEKHAIETALDSADGSRQVAAKHLGINRSTLYKKMKKFGLL